MKGSTLISKFIGYDRKLSENFLNEFDEVPAVVADIGAANCKTGTAGQDSPRHTFKSEVGVLDDRFLVGDVSLRCQSPAVIRKAIDYPNGVIHWDLVEQLMDHGYRELNVDPSKYQAMYTESHFTSMSSKEKLFEMCFERFQNPAVYMSPSASLSCFSMAKQTSLVIDAGASGVSVSPVVEGYVLSKAVRKHVSGGDAWDTTLQYQMEEQIKSNSNDNDVSGYESAIKPWFLVGGNGSGEKQLDTSFTAFHVKDVVRDVKKWMCFMPYTNIALAEKREEMMTSVMIPPYELPDGTHIQAADSLCTIPEVVFTRTAVGMPSGSDPNAVSTARPVSSSRKRSSSGEQLPPLAPPLDTANCSGSRQADQSGGGVLSSSLQELIRESLLHCDVDVRRELLNNIILVGGGSCLDGFSPRLIYELNCILPSSLFKVKTHVPLPLERLNAAWIGGSILSICGSFQQMWISKEEYSEVGPNILFQKLHC